MIEKYQKLSDIANAFEALNAASEMIEDAAKLIEKQASKNGDEQATQLLVDLAVKTYESIRPLLIAANGFGLEFREIIENEFGGSFSDQVDKDLNSMARHLAMELGAPGNTKFIRRLKRMLIAANQNK